MNLELTEITDDLDCRTLRRGSSLFFPIRRLVEFFVLRSAVHLVYLVLYLLVRGNEIIFWMFSIGGPILFLIQVQMSNLYLILKPFLASLVWPRLTFSNAFLAARKEIAQFWSWHGKMVYDHEIVNFERIPDAGGAILVYYHGCVPVDYLLVVSKTLLEKRRLIHSVIDRMMGLVPGFGTLAQAFGCQSCTRKECTKLLLQGKLVGIAPGGGYEAQLGTPDYKVMWKKRSGFAAVAFEAEVPIIPIFTENIREAFVNMQTGYRLWEFIYRWTKIPAVPVYGGYPVKLRTHIGEPIHPGDFENVEGLRVAVIKSMETIIERYQKTPGSILRAVQERIASKSSKTRRLMSNNWTDESEHVVVVVAGDASSGQLNTDVTARRLDQDDQELRQRIGMEAYVDEATNGDAGCDVTSTSDVRTGCDVTSSSDVISSVDVISDDENVNAFSQDGNQSYIDEDDDHRDVDNFNNDAFRDVSDEHDVAGGIVLSHVDDDSKSDTSGVSSWNSSENEFPNF